MAFFTKQKNGLELLKEKIEQSNKDMIIAVEDMRKARDKLVEIQGIQNELFNFVRDLQQHEIDEALQGGNRNGNIY